MKQQSLQTLQEELATLDAKLNPLSKEWWTLERQVGSMIRRQRELGNEFRPLLEKRSRLETRINDAIERETGIRPEEIPF